MQVLICLQVSVLVYHQDHRHRRQLDADSLDKGVTDNLLGQFDEVADSEKRLERSNAFILVGSPYTPTKFWDEDVEHYTGVKHFGVLPPTHVATPQAGALPSSSQSQGGGSQLDGGVAAVGDQVASPANDLGENGGPVTPVVEIRDTPPLGPVANPPAPPMVNQDGNDDRGNQPDGEGEPAPNGGDDEEIRKEKKRKQSREWHAKWVKKGVPRVAPSEPEPVPAAGDHGDACESPELPPPANMREACQRFVTRWINESGLPPSNERRRAAYTAWNNSEERSALMAGRANVQI